MNLLTSRKSWLLAPVVFVLCLAGLLTMWAALEPAACIRFVDADGKSPLELMTLPLFGLVIPMAWLTCPVGGSLKRQIFWSADFSILGFAAVCREEDLHKAFCHWVWPDLARVNFNFKMKFFLNDAVPLSAKVLVVAFYAAIVLAVAFPLCRYLIPLFIDFFRLKPVAWTMAFFGGCAAVSQLVDGLDGKLAKLGVECSSACIAFLRVVEEGGEMMMALFALVAILQSHLIFNRGV